MYVTARRSSNQMDFNNYLEVAHDHLLQLMTLALKVMYSAVNADGFPKSSILSDGFDFLTKINELENLFYS
jgi:hypothetical protein